MESVIIADNLIKIYHSSTNNVKALDKVSLEISSGEFLMITGRNGSGKSTLLHQLALLDEYDSGEIIINNQKTSHLSERKRMDLRLRGLGYIFQEYALIGELSALENVMLPAMMLESSKEAKAKAFEILEKVDLREKCFRLPSELSGGEQQRVAIARSLINSPKIIFADEPTANLDSTSSKKVLEIFKSLNKKDDITIVMVTHEPEELAYASRHIQLADGRIV
ncbi:MAG: ABC transporter ATP-binding protein [Patescibacteria group bacterium]|jgi:putative ABC transport system ATP-binding protein